MSSKQVYEKDVDTLVVALHQVIGGSGLIYLSSWDLYVYMFSRRKLL